MPDTEIVSSDEMATEAALSTSGRISVESTASFADTGNEYPTDFSDLNRLQNVMFGSDYIYHVKGSDQNALTEELFKKYA